MYTIHNLIPVFPSPSVSTSAPSLSTSPSLAPSSNPSPISNSSAAPTQIHGTIQSHLPPTELLKSIGLALAFILPIMLICTIWGVLRVRGRARERREEEERVRMGGMGLGVLGMRMESEGMEVKGQKTSRFTKMFERKRAEGRRERNAEVDIGGEGGEHKSRFARFVAMVQGKDLSTTSNTEYDIEKGVPRIVLTVPAPAVSKGGAKGYAEEQDLAEGMPVVAYVRGESVESRV